jgi:hypothetical protein
MKVRNGLLWRMLFLVIFVMPVLPASGQGFPVLGGPSEVSVNDPEVIAAVNFAVGEQDRREREQGSHGHIRLMSILGATQQVVAGTNYTLRLKVKAHRTEKEATAVVWRKLSGGHELTSWQWL